MTYTYWERCKKEINFLKCLKDAIDLHTFDLCAHFILWVVYLKRWICLVSPHTYIQVSAIEMFKNTQDLSIASDIFVKWSESHSNQGSTITIKSPCMITYMCQNFGVRDKRGQMPRKTYIRRHIFYLLISLKKISKLVLT